MNRIDRIASNNDLLKRNNNGKILSLISIIQNNRDEINAILDRIKRDKLFSSKIHGEFHSEKVFLFSYLIAHSMNLTELEKEILFDAAIYHDIGRSDDDEDMLHGFISANHIETVIEEKQIYQNPHSLNLLKAIMDGHSQDDSRKRKIFDYYELPEEYYAVYDKLYSILKDADALDKKRFIERSLAQLDPKYLRNQISTELIDFAQFVNNMYFEFMKDFYVVIDETNMPAGDCLHSVGFDFFKIASILENGILSYSMLIEKGITPSRNFDGGNTNRWISVVSLKSIEDGKGANEKFVKKGISFYCKQQKLHLPLPPNKKNEAIVQGLPYDKGGFRDEGYVFQIINPSDIVKIMIPKGLENTPLSQLNYLLSSISIDYIKDKLNYYFNKIGYSPSEEELRQITLTIKNCQLLEEQFINANRNEKRLMHEDVTTTLKHLAEKINKIIAVQIEQYYRQKTGIPEGQAIFAKDAVEYELSKIADLEFSFSETDGGTECIVSRKIKKM